MDNAFCSILKNDTNNVMFRTSITSTALDIFRGASRPERHGDSSCEKPTSSCIACPLPIKGANRDKLRFAPRRCPQPNVADETISPSFGVRPSVRRRGPVGSICSSAYLAQSGNRNARSYDSLVLQSSILGPKRVCA